MDLVVYAMYVIGLMAAYSALVVNLFVRVPLRTAVDDGEWGRFAEWAGSKAVSLDGLTPSGRLVTVDVPQARAA